jgi:hypothetical protein
MPKMFCVTYEIVTFESAENSEAFERGYLDEYGFKSDERVMMTLREANRICFPQEDSGRCWREVDGFTYSQYTGATEFRTIHPPRNITPSSYARVSKILLG